MKKISSFHIIAMATLGPGFSGGDRIFIELAKRWGKFFPIKIYVWQEGKEMCRRQSLQESKNLKFVLWKINFWCKLGFYACYLARIVKSIFESLRLGLKNDPTTYVYSASDFWMDSIPGWILKLRFPKVTWVATYYLGAPSPFTGFREQGGFQLPTIKGIFYWLQQQPIYWLTRIFADKVCVTSQPDLGRFPKQNKDKKVIVVRGGVNIPRKIKKVDKIFDGVFLGRLHPQKGVLELVDIWSRVVKSRPNAKLVMIGDGPLMSEVREKVKSKKLTRNITLTGTLLDGPKKFGIFQQSKIFMHSAVYDSGGMSCAEGMAWGMPGVAFDLEALKTYYPKGVLKAPIGDLNTYAKLVLKLLDDKNLYQRTTEDAIALVKEYWDWDKRAQEILREFALP